MILDFNQNESALFYGFLVVSFIRKIYADLFDFNNLGIRLMYITNIVFLSLYAFSIYGGEREMNEKKYIYVLRVFYIQDT